MKKSELMTKRMIMILVIVLSIALSAGLYPVIDLNPQNTESIGTGYRLFILFATVTAYFSLGKMQAVLMLNRDVFLIALFNLLLCLAGLMIRAVAVPFEPVFSEILIHSLLITLLTAGSALKEIHRLKRK